MTLDEIKQAVRDGHTVHWSNPGYTVIEDSIGQWLIRYEGGLGINYIGLTWSDGTTMNGEPDQFYVPSTTSIRRTYDVTFDGSFQGANSFESDLRSRPGVSYFVTDDGI